MRCALLVAVIFTGMVRPASAQTGPLAPVGGPPSRVSGEFEPSSTGQLPPEPPVSATSTPHDRPPNVLGPPVMGAPVRPSDREPQPPQSEAPLTPGVTTPIIQTSGTALPSGNGRRATLGVPVAAGSPIESESLEVPTRTVHASGGGDDPVNDLLVQRSPRRTSQRQSQQDQPERGEPRDRAAGKFGDKIGETFENVGDKARDWFKSDHCFDGFISPVTNPLLFEDPRSLTEVRPIFMYQQIPSSQPDFKGGSIWYYGMQARLAVTERLSFTFNKLAGTTINPGSGSGYTDQTGFAEIWLGPKYTILRRQDSGTLLAGGVQFQVPIGSANVYQNTGSLSLVPYLTFGQNFGRELRLGSFNTLVATGYTFALDNVRSDYYWLSGHLDFDVLNKHRFYPLAEMNWYFYTKNGKGLPIGVEGRDLFNFGGQAANTGLLTAAVGARFKLREWAQFGGALEFPLAGPRDIFNYRVTLDFILRY